MSKYTINTSNLTKEFGAGRTKVTAVDHIDLSIQGGEIVLIMGPSGSGKTTLLSMIGGLLTPTSGHIEIDGVNITKLNEAQLPSIRAQKIGFIFQGFNLLDALTVEENIIFPSLLVAQQKKRVVERANYLLETLNIAHRRNSLPKTLSGGEKQRVAIARAMINEAPILLADEPTGNLDSQNGQDVMMILHELARDKKCTVLIVTHDPRVEEIADKILWLEDGKLHDRRIEKHLWAIDPVCGMKVDQWTASITSKYNDETFYFCTSKCKARFDADPTKYVSSQVFN